MVWLHSHSSVTENIHIWVYHFTQISLTTAESWRTAELSRFDGSGFGDESQCYIQAATDMGGTFLL